MRAIIIALIACQSLLALAVPPIPPTPTWASRYFATGVFRIPYFAINEQFDVYFDGVSNRQRIDFYGGMDTFIYRFDTGNGYEIVPRIKDKICMTSSTNGQSPVTIIPDLSSWQYAGPVTIRGTACYTWMLTVDELNNKTSLYYFFVTAAEPVVPVQFVMFGIDSVFDSHPDIYIIDYDTYVPDFNDSTVFDPPQLCNNAKQSNPGHNGGMMASLRQLGGLVPQAKQTKPAKTSSPIELSFNLFMNRFGKSYSDEAEYELRLEIFAKHSKFIADFNGNPENTFALAMNHYGDMLDEEFRRIVTPKVERPQNNGAQSVHEEPLDVKGLPSSVDWRTKGAVTPIKDQGSCGSCWTFGTAGSLEGCFAAKYGKLIPLSEQQIVDCAWTSWGGEGGNMGCDGGYASGAFQWIINNGGIATEVSYPYLQQDAWCNSNDRSSGITVKGYVNVTSGSESALQSAVATAGPVAVAIDAAHLEFRFYASGVYYNPKCKNDLNDLDHEVLAIGYGTESGQDYWIVKNSWSPHWGDKGFIKMARNHGNNCGIATQATYPLV